MLVHGRLYSRLGIGHKRYNFKQIIAYCELIHNAMICQIRLGAKNDLAWQSQRYDTLVGLLTTEFELEQRAEHLKQKIEVVNQGASTFIQFQQASTSHLLETAVIVLIALEIVVSLSDMGMRWWWG